ncbi:MAG: TonB-dependent receptor [Prolixibacteraceae bacterium]|nr:TonB-dependent receptor [Prolixibacteraceae bacterium]
MKKILTVLLMVMAVSVFAQRQNINGKVTDSAGGGIPGVSVVVKGTTTGSITDSNGNYSLTNVPVNATLQFSFVGMKSQEIAAAGKTSINVTLAEETVGIDEVVAIGYGTQKKATVTGSIATIKGEELSKNPSSNFVAALQGQMPGLTVNMRNGDPGNEGLQILVRGKSTLGSTGVLVVIDGVAGGDITILNPADIESISVLKDASAAIYGARAANGVILVTTKRGKIGKPQLNYSGNFGATQPTRMQNLMDSWEYAVAENEFLKNNGQTAKWSDQDITLFKNGTDPLFHPNVDWYDVSFRKWTPQKQHNLTLSGGTESIKYFLSGQIVDQDRMFKENDGKGLDRYQLRANIDAQVTKILKVGIDMNYSKEIVENAYQGNYRNWWDITRMMPNAVAFWPNGLPGPTQFGYNPAIEGSSEKFGYNRENTFNYGTKLSFDLDLSQITDGLSLSGFGRFSDGSQNFEKFFKQSYFYNYDAVKDEYIKMAAGQIVQSPELQETNNRSQSKTYNIKIGYQKQFGAHNIDAFVAYEQSESNYAGFTAYRKNFITDQLPVLSAGGDVGKDNSGYKSDGARINYFGRLNYGYKEKYLVSATLRYDGSQNFPTDNRFGLFPGVSAGWILSQESFIKDNYAFVDVLKIKGSWGQMGNDAVPAYQYLATYNYGNGYYFGNPSVKYAGLQVSTTPNPGITWEIAETTNFGFESVLWKGLFSFNLDVFQSKRKNILTKKNASTPDYSGLTLPDVNIGTVENNGFEMEIIHSKVVTNDFRYSVSGNMSYAKNRVTFFDESPNVADFQKKTGYPIDSYLLYQADGIYQTQAEIDATPHLPNTAPGDIKYLDVNDDKKIDGKDMVRETLSFTPEIVYGINLGAKYKNWEISALFQGQARSKTRIIPEGIYMDKEFFNGRWLKEGDNKYPRSFNSNRNAVGNNALESTFWLKSGAFMRMKNVELAYTLPKTLTDRVNISYVRLFVNGSNLFIIYDHIKIVDPEQNGLSQYPIQRMVNVGVSINF